MPDHALKSDPARTAEVVSRLVLAARRGHSRPAVEAADFPWDTPHPFTPEQVQRLDAFAAKALPRMLAALNKAVGAPLPLEAAPSGTAYFRDVAGTGNYYAITLQLGGVAVGLLRLGGGFACACVEKLLGGAGKLPADDRELSALEKSLLMDICTAVMGAFSLTFREAGGQVFGVSAELSKNNIPVPMPPDREMMRFSLRLKGDDALLLSVVLPCDIMEFVAKGLPKPQPAVSAEECRKLMLSSLSEAPLCGEVWLRPAATTMKDVLDLEPGDVLLLPQGLDEPVDLTIQGRQILQAVLGAQQGKYALEILSLANPPR